MHRSKKKRNIIIFSLVGVLLCMAAGYAAFQTQLKVSGTSQVTSNWDIEITNVTSGTPTGSAENTVAPSWDKLWASMEADLYDKGDAMEYDVTIENKGTLDAKLNDIITNLENSNNDAVIITFSGYTKGEVLKSKATKIIHVKIEYNPEYEGGETSSEVEVNFDYTQNNNEENNPDSQYLLTYDYQTNGGQSVELTEELLQSGSNVDLSNTATKEGWNFVGWNTDKDAQIGLENYQMPTSNITLYAIYSKTLKVTYEKGDNIESIGKNEDSCNIYNNQTSCEVTLPEITSSDNTAILNWYIDQIMVGKPNNKYKLDKDTTLTSKADGEPYMMSRDDNYAFWTEEYRTKIKTIDFVNNKNIPDNAVISWDVSNKKDNSVVAWLINDSDNTGYYKLYIGGTDKVIANTNCSDFFDYFNEVTTINLQQLDTSRVTNMHDFFCDDWNLETIVFGKFNTSKVTDMSGMFGRCTKLENLNLSSLDTSNVIDMSYMFHNCDSLKELDLHNFDTSRVTNMQAMFNACNSLILINVKGFDTKQVTNMRDMFSYSPSLESIIGLEGFNTSKVTNMIGMFNFDSSLEKLNLCSFNTSNVIEMWLIFGYTLNLKSIYVGSNWTTEKAEANGQAYSMFSNSGVSEVTQTNNCEIAAEDISLNISSSYTTNSITVIANAYADSGIAKYEYSKDGGKTWEQSSNTHYTFTQLNAGTSYDITVKITSNVGKTISTTKTITTSAIAVPTFQENSDGNVEITYPEGCGATYICTYQKNEETPSKVTGPTANLSFGEDGNVIATVSNGTNSVSSSYTIIRKKLFVSSNGSDTNGYGTREKPYLTLQKTYDSATSTTQATIYVMSDLDISTSTKFNSSSKNIILKSDDINNETYTLNKTVSYGDTIISVDDGQATFSNIIFEGNNIEDTNCALYAGSGTKIKVNNGVIIQNFINNSNTGGTGIRGSGANITINGAKIINNKGLFDVGIKIVDGKLKFIDGEVSNNEATDSAAGILVDNTQFIMSGGIISNNKSHSKGGGLYINNSQNGNDSWAVLNGGKITNNYADNQGGGIYVRGVAAHPSTLTINGTSIFDFDKAVSISGNQSAYGGGIYSENNTVIKITSGMIKENFAFTGSGGGIYALGTITISGGIISDNIANTFGGGLMCKTNCTMTGGTISDNTATVNNGGGVRVDGTFTLNGGTIKNNSAKIDGGISNINKYIYQSGVVCGNKPTNSYETSTSCPAT